MVDSFKKIEQHQSLRAFLYQDRSEVTGLLLGWVS